MEKHVASEVAEIEAVPHVRHNSHAGYFVYQYGAMTCEDPLDSLNQIAYRCQKRPLASSLNTTRHSMYPQSFLLADFMADNAMPILGLMASVLVAVLGGVIHLVIAIAKLNTTTQFLKERMDEMGKSSMTSRDSVREDIENLKLRVNGFEVALARCTHPH